MCTTLLVNMLMVSALVGQAPATSEREKADADARLEFMKKSVNDYKVTLADDAKTVLKFQPEPAFRLGKQAADNLVDGAIFFWRGAGGKPEAAIQVYQLKDSSSSQGQWIHEFTSLASCPLTAARDGQSIWMPSSAGVEFKPLPDTPFPPRQAAQRGLLMNELAKRFRASDAFKQKGWSELRLLPKPVTRYCDEKSNVVDGALYTFVLATDTEVFLLLEARSIDRKLEWYYALAPMTVFALKCSYQGKTVWELPDRIPAENPTMPFFYTNINR